MQILAGTGRRVIARSVDYVVHAVLIAFAMMPVLMDGGTIRAAAGDGGVRYELWIGLFLAAGWYVRRMATVALWGCTLGRRVTGIRVVHKDEGVRPPGFRRAYERWYPLQFFQGEVGVPLSSEALSHRSDELGQCRHDKKAQTVVILAR